MDGLDSCVFLKFLPIKLHGAIASNGQVRLGGSIRNYFQVRTILNSTGCCKLPCLESSNRGPPEVRSVNKSRDTLNCVQNEPEYAICVLFTTHLYYKALGIICVFWYGKYATITIVLTMSTVTLQVTARCQHWARPVPWCQSIKFPYWCDRLRHQNCLASCKTYWKWKRVVGFTLWCRL